MSHKQTLPTSLETFPKLIQVLRAREYFRRSPSCSMKAAHAARPAATTALKNQGQCLEIREMAGHAFC